MEAKGQSPNDSGVPFFNPEDSSPEFWDLGSLFHQKFVILITLIAMLAITLVFSPSAAASSAYTWSYNANGGGGTMTQSLTFSTCRANPLTSSFPPTRAGFSLIGWSLGSKDGTFLGNGNYENCTNITLFAQWNYLVTIDGNGGTANQSSIRNAAAGIVLPTATRDGFTLKGWFSASSGGTRLGGVGEIYNPNSNVTVYAQWEVPNYTVSYASNGGIVTPTSATFTVGDPPLTLPTPSRTAHTFNGWYTAESGGTLIGEAGATYTPTTTTTLHAQWVPETYVISYAANGGIVTPTSATFTVGDPPLTLPTPSRTAHIFNGWYTAESGGTLIGEAGANYTPTTTTTLHAQWQLIPSPVPAPNPPAPQPDVRPKPKPPGDQFAELPDSEPAAIKLLVPAVLNLRRQLVLTPKRMFTSMGQEIGLEIKVEQRGKKGRLVPAKRNTFVVIRRPDGYVAVRRLARQPLRVNVTWFADQTPQTQAFSVTKVYWIR